MGNLNVDERILLKQIIEKYDMRMWRTFLFFYTIQGRVL
jgi:hypothetical protein